MTRLLTSGLKLSKNLVTFQVTYVCALLKIAENSTRDLDFFLPSPMTWGEGVHMENVHLQKNNFHMNLQEIRFHE